MAPAGIDRGFRLDRLRPALAGLPRRRVQRLDHVGGGCRRLGLRLRRDHCRAVTTAGPCGTGDLINAVARSSIVCDTLPPRVEPGDSERSRGGVNPWTMDPPPGREPAGDGPHQPRLGRLRLGSGRGLPGGCLGPDRAGAGARPAWNGRLGPTHRCRRTTARSGACHARRTGEPTGTVFNLTGQIERAVTTRHLALALSVGTRNT